MSIKSISLFFILFLTLFLQFSVAIEALKKTQYSLIFGILILIFPTLYWVINFIKNSEISQKTIKVYSAYVLLQSIISILMFFIYIFSNSLRLDDFSMFWTLCPYLYFYFVSPLCLNIFIYSILVNHLIFIFFIWNYNVIFHKNKNISFLLTLLFISQIFFLFLLTTPRLIFIIPNFILLFVFLFKSRVIKLSLYIYILFIFISLILIFTLPIPALLDHWYLESVFELVTSCFFPQIIGLLCYFKIRGKHLNSG